MRKFNGRHYSGFIQHKHTPTTTPTMTIITENNFSRFYSSHKNVQAVRLPCFLLQLQHPYSNSPLTSTDDTAFSFNSENLTVQTSRILSKKYKSIKLQRILECKQGAFEINRKEACIGKYDVKNRTKGSQYEAQFSSGNLKSFSKSIPYYIGVE